MNGATSPPETRRERLRAATISDIKAAARAHIARHGMADFSLRAIARDLGMSAPGLYRYYDRREALLTALIAEAFEALAATMVSARDRLPEQDLGGRVMASALAYRGWAVAHPQEFGMIYGSPVPGYAAPPAGPTVAAARSVGQAFLEPCAAAWREGALRPRPTVALPAAVAQRLAPALATMAQEIGPAFPPDLAHAIHSAYARIHGLVVLEVFHHLAWLVDDGSDLFHAELLGLIADLGLPAPQDPQAAIDAVDAVLHEQEGENQIPS